LIKNVHGLKSAPTYRTEIILNPLFYFATAIFTRETVMLNHGLETITEMSQGILDAIYIGWIVNQQAGI